MLLAITRILNVVLENQSTATTLAVILVTGLLATAYTALGGVKAVIWTDASQFCIMFGGLLVAVVIIIGNIPGGLYEILQASHSRTFGRFLRRREIPSWK